MLSQIILIALLDFFLSFFSYQITLFTVFIIVQAFNIEALFKIKNNNACVYVYVLKFARYLYSPRANRFCSFQLMVPKLASSLLLQTSLWIDSISFYPCKVTCLTFISCFHACARLIRFYMAPPPFLWSPKCRGNFFVNAQKANCTVSSAMQRSWRERKYRFATISFRTPRILNAVKMVYAHRVCKCTWHRRETREHIYICFEILLSCSQGELQFKYS